MQIDNLQFFGEIETQRQLGSCRTDTLERVIYE